MVTSGEVYGGCPKAVEGSVILSNLKLAVTYYSSDAARTPEFS